MEYTKGEWKTKMSVDGSRIIYAEKDTGDESICRDVSHYNMNLIAAAPDMYEALDDIQAVLSVIIEDGYITKNSIKCDAETVVARAKRARAKAEGVKNEK